MLVTNPIPEEYSMDPDVINKAIDEAIAEAKEQGIHGKATTPFLLAKVKELTGGDSLDSNIQLVYNNAALAAKTACRAVQDGLRCDKMRGTTAWLPLFFCSQPYKTVSFPAQNVSQIHGTPSAPPL